MTASRGTSVALSELERPLLDRKSNAAVAGLSFDDRFSLLVDREQSWRENRRLTRLLRDAKLKSSQAYIEDIR